MTITDCFVCRSKPSLLIRMVLPIRMIRNAPEFTSLYVVPCPIFKIAAMSLTVYVFDVAEISCLSIFQRKMRKGFL